MLHLPLAKGKFASVCPDTKEMAIISAQKVMYYTFALFNIIRPIEINRCCVQERGFKSHFLLIISKDRE